MSRLLIAPIAVVLAVAGCASPTTGTAASPATPAGTSPTAAAVPASPTEASPADASPTAGATTTTAAAPSKTATTKATTKAAVADGCPVSADTLTAISVPGYSAGEIDVVASSIRCANGWAQADPGIENGDGVMIYQYSAGSKSWKYKIEGSSIDCGELGIPRATGKKLSVCYYQ